MYLRSRLHGPFVSVPAMELLRRERQELQMYTKELGLLTLTRSMIEFLFDRYAS